MLGKILVEFQLWLCFLVSLIPGGVGNFIRNRYYKSRCNHLGINCIFNPLGVFFHPQHLSVFNNVTFNYFVMINAAGGVEIHDNCLIGPGVKIWSINHHTECLAAPIKDQGYIAKKVILQKNVWVGANAVILPGVEIGEGAVIGAGSVVTKNVPEFTIVAGSPATCIKIRNYGN